MFNAKSVKSQMMLFLAAFSVYEAVIAKSASLLLPVLVCVTAAVVTEASLLLAEKKRWVSFESAVISGLIIGLVLSGGQVWYIYAAAAVLAIGSKHLLRFQKKHLFNPAAFGILATTLLFSATTQWTGTYQWHILVPAGVFFTWRTRKVVVLGSYLFTALGLWGIQAVLQHVPVRYIFGYLSYFFIFIMLIEPKTVPVTRAGKMGFGVVVAASIFIFTEWGVGFDVELGSLLIGNAAVPLLNRLKQKVVPDVS